MEELSLLQMIINGGPALILLIGIIFVWKTWRSDQKQFREEMETARSHIEEIQEQRVKEALEWSAKYNEIVGNVKDSLNAVDNFVKITEKVLTQGGHNARD